VENTQCEVCHGAEETPAHVIFGCTAAKEFWDAISFGLTRIHEKIHKFCMPMSRYLLCAL
jgi:hypothetical protein